MPRTTSAAPRPARSPRTTCVLVGRRASTRRGASILEREGFHCACVLPEQTPGRPDFASENPRAVILFAAGPARELARTIRSLTAAVPDAPVILLAARLERWDVRSALAAGASGVVSEDENLAGALLSTLRAVLAGQTCVPSEHGVQLTPPALSSREKQILGLVVMGYMNCQIAETLFLAESTVKSHLSSAFTKLGVRSRNEAARLILDPERGFGTGILALSAEPRELTQAASR